MENSSYSSEDDGHGYTNAYNSAEDLMSQNERFLADLRRRQQQQQSFSADFVILGAIFCKSCSYCVGFIRKYLKNRKVSRNIISLINK